MRCDGLSSRIFIKSSGTKMVTCAPLAGLTFAGMKRIEMRWYRREKPESGDERIVRRFLIFPRCADGVEWRWLETANIRQRYIFGCWSDFAWIEEGEENYAKELFDR